MSTEQRIRRINDQVIERTRQDASELPMWQARKAAILDRLAQIEVELPAAFATGTGRGAVPLRTERAALQKELVRVNSRIACGESGVKYLEWIAA